MSSLERLASTPAPARAVMPSPSSLRGHPYGEDRLYLLARDPRSVFVAWEATPGLHALAEKSAHARSAAVRYGLRIERREREGSAVSAIATVDIPDALGGEGWYLSLPRAGGECRAVLGLRFGEAFEPLLHSRWVPIPPDAPCADVAPWEVSTDARAWLLGHFAGPRRSPEGGAPSSAARYLAPEDPAGPRR